MNTSIKSPRELIMDSIEALGGSISTSAPIHKRVWHISTYSDSHKVESWVVKADARRRGARVSVRIPFNLSPPAVTDKIAELFRNAAKDNAANEKAAKDSDEWWKAENIRRAAALETWKGLIRMAGNGESDKPYNVKSGKEFAKLMLELGSDTEIEIKGGTSKVSFDLPSEGYAKARFLVALDALLAEYNVKS